MQTEPESLLSLYAPLFPPMRQRRGQQLFDAGLARFDCLDPRDSTIYGEVDDPAGRRERTYGVSLMPGSDGLDPSCACSGPGYCEHAYALLLLVDEMGRRALAEKQRGEAGARPAVPVRQPAAAQKPMPAPATPKGTWRTRLAAATEALRMGGQRQPEPAPTTAPHPLTFVIDLAETRRVRAVVVVAMEPVRQDAKDMLRARAQKAEHPPVSAADRQALQLLDAVDSRLIPEPGTYTIPGEYQAGLLPLLCEGGRVCHIDSLRQPSGRPLQRLAFDSGPPFRVSTALQRSAHGMAVHGALQRGNETLLPSAVLLLLEGGFAILNDRIVAVAIGGAAPLARTLLMDGPLEAPAAEADEMLRSVVELTLDDPTLSPPVPTRLAPEPTPVLVARLSRPLSTMILAELQFDYRGRTIGPDDDERVLTADHDGALLLRNDAAEERLFDAFEAAHGKQLTPSTMLGCYLLPKKTVLAELTRLVGAGVRVLIDGKPMLPSTGFKVSVATGIDWFDVGGEVVFADGSSLPLARAILSARRGERLVELGDGRTGVLPEALLGKWASVLELGEKTDGGVRLQRGQAMLLDALLASRDATAVDADADFDALRERIASFRGITPRPAPEGFCGTLRDYQGAGLAWLCSLRELGLGGCLADDMGLGKTVQVLALLLEVHRDRRGPPSLLVVPRSLLDNWAREAARFTPRLRVLDFGTPDRWQRAGAAAFAEHDVVLTTYGTLRSDVPRFTHEQITFEYAILDEAQAIENAQSVTSKAARLVRSKHRLALTGTPVQNHIGELWALFEFLSPGMLGRSKTFQELLSQGRGRGGKPGSGFDVELLRAALAPFLLRRTKEQVLKELPAKQEQTIHCDLVPGQRRIYDSLRDHYRDVLLKGTSKLDKKERFVALEALLRLRQAACHPKLVDRASSLGSAKLDALLPMLKEIVTSGHKALVFSQFTEFLAIVRRELTTEGLHHEYLDGKTSNRQQCVDRFQQDPDCRLFLISLKAGGFGLNLTAADYVFLLDPWWNPAAEAQAVDRAHRIGQVQRVVAYRLVAKDTVEEKVLQLQAEKRALVDAVLGGDQSLLAGITREDLARILG